MIEKIKKRFKEKFSPQGKRVKVPTVLQMEATECGAASLAMILAHFGKWVPLEKLRQECGVNRDGSKASSIVKAARRRNCAVRGFRCMAGEFLEEKQDFPIIIHWEFNHFVVLEGIINDKVYINDPAIGKRVIELITVASNGFWGLWANEKIDKILSAASLDTIFFSSDAFHREYVSLEALKGAIAACRRAAIHCSVSVGDAKGKYNASDFIRDLGEAKYYVDLNLYPFYRVGRAENLSEDIFYRLRPIAPRCYDDGALGMRPDGLVFPCYSPAAFDTCLHLGNIRKQSSADMLRDNPCVDLCNLLQDSESFQKLTSIAVEKGLLTAAQRDLSPCEQYNLMFREKSYDVLKKYAADLYDELLVKKLFA